MPPSRRRFIQRLLGDFFLGLALGLLAYEALTGVFTWQQQGRLRTEFDRLASASTTSTGRGRSWDFEGWREEDVAYWRGLDEGGVFGRIVARKAGIDDIVVKGVSHDDLERGPGWATYTDVPGPSGNAGISGHRTTYLAPFRRLDRLSAGDTIDVFSPYRRYRYQVFRVFRVTPDRVDVMTSTPSPQLTLTACDPPYSARFRLVVQARLVDVRRTAPRR